MKEIPEHIKNILKIPLNRRTVVERDDLALFPNKLEVLLFQWNRNEKYNRNITK